MAPQRLLGPTGVSLLVAGDANLGGVTLDGAAVVGGNLVFSAASRITTAANGIDAGAYGTAGLVVGGVIDLSASTTTLSVERGANTIVTTDIGDFLTGSPVNHYVSRGLSAEAQPQVALAGGQVLRGTPFDIAGQFTSLQATSAALVGLAATPCATGGSAPVAVVTTSAATVPATAPVLAAGQLLVVNLLDTGAVTLAPPSWSLPADQAARVLWNVPNATSLTIVGTNPLTGSLLAPTVDVVDHNPAWITGSVVAHSLRSGDASSVGGSFGLATADLAADCLGTSIAPHVAAPTPAPPATPSAPAGQVAAPVYDLALIVRYASSPVFIKGATLDYEIVVANQGTVASGAYSVQDTLPGGMSLVAAGNGGTPVAGTISWVGLPSLAPGAHASLHFSLRMDAIDQPSYRNLAEISADSGDDRDSTPDNNPYDDALIDSDDPAIELVGDSDDHDVTDASANQVRFDNQRLIAAAAADAASADGLAGVRGDAALTPVPATVTAPLTVPAPVTRSMAQAGTGAPFAGQAARPAASAGSLASMPTSPALPATGGSSVLLLIIASVLVAVGALLVSVRRLA